MQRNKGAAFERDVAEKLRKVYPGAKRGLGQARQASEVADVTGTPYWVECKHKQRPNIAAALEQAFYAEKGRVHGEIPHGHVSKPVLAITKANNERAIASMYLEDFIDLVQELERLRTEADDYDRLDNPESDPEVARILKEEWSALPPVVLRAKVVT